MKVAPVADVKAHFSAYLKSSREGLVVVTRNGKPSAVILGITDEDEIERLSLAYSPKFNRILDSARREIRKGKGIPHDAFWAEMEGRKK
jgi:prevent-host-death family protein